MGILGGTLIATALKALFDIGSTVSANKYNSPVAQLRRLRRAGLPMTYLYQGRVNQQSQTPQLSIDPHLGTLAKIQGSKVKADTTVSKEIGDNLSKENQIKDLMSGVIQPDGTEWNNRATQMIAERDKAIADSFIKKYESQLKKIELDVERDAFGKNIPQEMKQQALDKAKQQVLNLLEQAGLMQQLKKIRGFDELLNNSLTKDLNNLPDWVSSLLKVILIATRRK